MIRVAASLLVASLVAGCGFHMRGDLSLPPVMASTYIAFGGTDANLRRTIARALALADVNVAHSAQNAGAILHIASAGVGRRVLSKDTSGRPREYEVSAVIVYAVTTPEGLQVVPRQRVERRTNVVLDPAQPLANSGDVARAVDILRDEAVWDMLRRIAATEAPVQVPGAANGAMQERSENGSEPGTEGAGEGRE